MSFHLDTIDLFWTFLSEIKILEIFTTKTWPYGKKENDP